MCLAAVNGYRLWQLRRQGITKTNTQANWHGHCTVAYMNTTHGDVTLNCSTKGRTEPGNGEIANTPTNQIWKCKTKSKIPSNPVNQFAGILRVFCGYSAGILRVFCGIYGLCFSRAILLWICKGFAGRDGGWGEGGHESLRWRPTCEAGSLLENVWKQWANTRASPTPPRMQQTVLTRPLSWMETTAARVDIHVAGYSIKIMITSVGCSTGLGCPSCPTISVASWSHCHQTLARDDANYKPIVFHYVQ